MYHGLRAETGSARPALGSVDPQQKTESASAPKRFSPVNRPDGHAGQPHRGTPPAKRREEDETVAGPEAGRK
jgi:hypothetical protein